MQKNSTTNICPLLSKTIISLSLTVLFALSCSDDDTASSGNTNANNGEKYSKRIEIPQLQENDIFLTHTTTVNGKENITYSIAHNAQRKHSRWVAFTFDASNRDIRWKRDNWENTEWGGDPFQPCPELPENAQFTKNEINRNGYVRGHLVASYDRVYSKEANEQTFYYSNISPMYSRFNTGLWNDLENKVQNWGRNNEFCDTLYIVKGGTINAGKYRSETNNQGITCATIPDYYFMALLCRKNNEYKAIGFLFPHKSSLSGNLTDYALTIDALETYTGIDFFCNLPDRVELPVEKEITGNWTGL